jgi:HSP20 family protein
MACDPLRDLRAWQVRLEQIASQRSSPWAPPIDVYETEDRYVISAEVPGLAREQIQLSVQNNRLTIRGERPAGVPESATRHYHYHQVERGHGPFHRAVEFTEQVRHDDITADLRDGVLTVTLPKLTAPPRRIDVH